MKDKKTDEAGNELVLKSELDAAQARVAELEKQLAAQAPLQAAVKALTGKETVAEQVLELGALQARVAALPSAEQLQAREQADLVAKLRAKAPAAVVNPILAAAEAAGPEAGLAILRAAVADERVRGPRSFTPARPGRGSEPSKGEPMLTEEIKANYQRCGITDEAQMLAAERSRRAAPQKPDADEEQP